MQKQCTQRIGNSLIVLVALVCVLPLVAQATPFTFDDGDLNGVYAGWVLGSNVATTPPTPIAGIMRIVADGAGNLTVSIQRNLGGTFGMLGPLACTYVVAADGFTVVTCPGVILHVLLSDSGKQFDLIREGTHVFGGHFITQ